MLFASGVAHGERQCPEAPRRTASEDCIGSSGCQIPGGRLEIRRNGELHAPELQQRSICAWRQEHRHGLGDGSVPEEETKDDEYRCLVVAADSHVYCDEIEQQRNVSE